MKPINNLKATNPLQLLNEGRDWLSIYESKKDNNIFIAIYCLFTAFEFYLKAYLVLKDSTYKDTDKLKSIRHNFGDLFEKIVILEKNKFTNEINFQIDKYSLRNISLDRLKYPEDAKMWSVERGLEKGEHTLKNIFKDIDIEITAKSDIWLNSTYPKSIQIIATIQIGFEGNPEQIDLKSLSNVCSNCLPYSIIISENYNFPWGDETIPSRICERCDDLFNPTSMRQKDAC